MTRQLSADAVGRFFRVLWSHYCQDEVDLELLEVPPERTIRAVVFWYKGAWRLLADRALQGRKLLRVLFHELAHVLHGDAKKTDLAILSHVRSMFLGDETTEAKALELAMCRQAAAAEQQQQERDADAWSEEQTDRWFPVLETIEQTVKATVDRLLRG